MDVQIGGKTYGAADIRLSLRRDTSARLAIGFPAGAGCPTSSRLAAWLRAGERGTLRGEGGGADFEACGYDEGEHVRLRGRVVPPGLTAWFATHPQSQTVHQWQGPAQAPDAWAFVDAALGGKFARPAQDVVTACAAALPVGAAFCRPAGVSNQSFLAQVLALLALRLPALAGWHAVGDAAQPLRLVAGEQPTLLDDRWEPVASWHDDGPAWLAGKLRRAIDVKAPGALLEALAVRARPCEAKSLESPGDQAQIVAGPGFLRQGPARLFCAEASYHFPAGNWGAVTAELTFAAPPAHGPVPPAEVLDAQFEEWLEAGSDVAKLVPVGWTLAGAAHLHAELLVPTNDPGGKAAFYVKRRQGHPLRVLCLPGQLPTSAGARQRHSARLERNDLTLQAGSLRVKAPKASFTGAVTVFQKLDVAPPSGKED